jgi:formate dehydrogenase (NADP+) beta subunit
MPTSPYRDEMPVSAEEMEEAEEEGVKIELLVSPLRVIGNRDGKVAGLACIRNRLADPDAGGRPRPVPIEGSEFVLEVDTVLAAVSQSPDTSFLSNIFSRSPWDRVEVDPISLMTNVDVVFTVGDYITGPRHVISVIADAPRVSASIHRYLQGPLEKENGYCLIAANLPHAPGDNYDELPRQTTPTLPVKERKNLGDEVRLGFSPEMAITEAQRCLRCDYNIAVDGWGFEP